MHEIPVPKDTFVWVGNYNCGIAKEVWGEDALEWKPERWMGALPRSVGEAHIPGVFAHQYVDSALFKADVDALALAG